MELRIGTSTCSLQCLGYLNFAYKTADKFRMDFEKKSNSDIVLVFKKIDLMILTNYHFYNFFYLEMST